MISYNHFNPKIYYQFNMIMLARRLNLRIKFIGAKKFHVSKQRYIDINLDQNYHPCKLKLGANGCRDLADSLVKNEFGSSASNTNKKNAIVDEIFAC